MYFFIGNGFWATKDHLVYLKDMLEDDSLNKDKIEKEIEKTEKQLKNYEETYQKSIKFIERKEERRIDN